MIQNHLPIMIKNNIYQPRIKGRVELLPSTNRQNKIATGVLLQFLPHFANNLRLGLTILGGKIKKGRRGDSMNLPSWFT